MRFEKRRLNAIHTDNHELKQYAVLTERIKAGDEDAKNDIQKGAVRIEKLWSHFVHFYMASLLCGSSHVSLSWWAVRTSCHTLCT